MLVRMKVTVKVLVKMTVRVTAIVRASTILLSSHVYLTLVNTFYAAKKV